MKYSQWIGVIAALTLVGSCFIPWTWHPDLQKSFTGFYSEGNAYGKPGMFFVFFSVLTITLYLTPRVWAKRWNLFNCCLVLAYAIKSFILFAGCYGGICPEKQTGIWIMLTSCFVMMLAALLPNTAITNKNKQ